MNYHHLSRKERALIAQLYTNGITITQIACKLGRSKSSISREITRNGIEGKYRSAIAQAEYLTRRMNCHRKRRYEQREIVEYVTEKLELAWSPEQIAGRISIDHPHLRISFSSIYRWLDIQLLPRSVQLTMKLRHYGRKYGETRGVKVNARDIKERSKQVFRRKRLGDWEVDTIVSGIS